MQKLKGIIQKLSKRTDFLVVVRQSNFKRVKVCFEEEKKEIQVSEFVRNRCPNKSK